MSLSKNYDPKEVHPCSCGSARFIAETDVMDTWATSSMTPQIVGGWPAGKDPAGESLYERVFPFSMQPQGHEIIRTWAFYTIVKSLFHFGQIPWHDVAISGWGIAGERMGKISKSRGGGPVSPLEMIERYSADAVRYWAASTGLGKNAVISEEKIQTGSRLVTKIWNTARFSEKFLANYYPQNGAGLVGGDKIDHSSSGSPDLTPADHWILSRIQRLIRRVTQLFEDYEHAAAKREIENFFWNDFTDNYLEMCKQRLYTEDHPQRQAACFTLYHVLLTIIKLFAPFLPHVTEEIYQRLFAAKERPRTGKTNSIHLSSWPIPDGKLEDQAAERAGEVLVSIATAVRKYKSERNLPLNWELGGLELVDSDANLGKLLQEAVSDLRSVSRARFIKLVSSFPPARQPVQVEGPLRLAILESKEIELE